MENVFTTFFDLSKKEQENSVNCVNCVKPLNYQTLPSKNETEERDGYYERTARPVGKSRITSTRPGLNQDKTPITKMLQRVAMIFAVLVMSVANIGTAWADAASWKNNTMSPSSYFTLGSNTSAVTNAQTIGGTSYTHSINMTSKSGQSSNNTNGYFIRFTLTSASNVSILFKANGGSRTIRVCTGWSYDTSNNATQLANGATPSDGVKGTSSSVASGSTGTFDIDNLAAGTYYICGSGSVSIFEITIATSSNWYLKGSFDSWGDGYNMAGSGTVSVKRTLSANTKYEFKLMDGTNWYGNGHKFGGTETNTVSTNTENCYLMTSEAGSYKFDYNTSTNALTITYPNSYTYYYANSNTWSKVYVYKYTTASSITGKNAAWPGVEIASPSYSCGGTDYYEATSDGYAKLIFTNNDGSQTGNMTVASADDGKYVGGTGNSWSALPTYTISYNNGGGTGSMSSQSSIACGTDKTTTSNTFTAPSGYQFAGWVANVDVKAGGSTKTAGTVLDDGVTIQEVGSNITLTAQWEEKTCPTSGTVYSASTNATGDISIASGASNLTLTTATHKTTVTGGTMSVYNGQGSAKTLITSSGFAMTNNNTYFRVDLECALQAGDVISVDVGLDGSNTRGVWVSTATSRPGSAPACALTAKNASLVPVTYTVTGSDEYHGESTLYIYRATENGTKFNNISITRPSGECTATQPGTISKGTLSGCTLRLTAAGSPETNNTWYWQSSESGTDKTESGATKDVTSAGTYYIRSYCSTGSGCWSDARSVVVSASDLTPAAPTALAKSSVTAKGATLTVTDAANTNDYEFYVNTSSSAPSAGTSASYTSTSKSVTITDKYAGTTFYAWARAKCGSNKSAWTALGDGGTFTTSTVTVTHTLTNVTKTSGAETAGGSEYTAVFAAVSGYSMPTPTVTIDGNTATSGTDYTWSSGTLTIPANKINGNIVITLNSAAAAPSSVAISGELLYFAGETIELTATPTGGNGPVTYQWYKGGKENGNAIEGATNATYTKATCAFDDAGSYYCKVTCGGSQSTWGQSGDAYEVKIPRLYVKTGRNDGVKSDFGNVDFTRVTASTATASITLGSNWDYCFNIADGCGHYYGNAGTMQYNNVNSPWVTNMNNQDCGLRTTNGAAYVFTINYSDWTQLTTTVTYPSVSQAADKVIYFDNNDRKWSALHYRIGRVDNTQATAMTKVPGTDNLYKVTTPAYNNFMGWHIANNAGWTSSNSIYRTYTNGDAYSITYATAHEGGAVTESAVTVTPTTSRGNGSDAGINDNCEFYNYTITNGMKRDRVTITAPVNGTVTVNYTSEEDVASSFSATTVDMYQDLAHTVILTSITATPNTGYDLGAITINGGAYSANYVVTAATTIAATFNPKTYTITLDKNGGTANGTATVAYNATSLSDITHATNTGGYTLVGYYDIDGPTDVLKADGSYYGENITDGSSYQYISDGKWVADGDQTLKAYWKCNAPTISFNSATNTVTISGCPTGATIYYTTDGSTPGYPGTAYSAPFTIAEDCTVKAIAYKDGCADSDVASLDCDYVAPVSTTVTYNYNGATSGASPANETAASVTLPTPTRTDYELQGWYTTAGTKVGDGGDTYEPEADITLYAKWYATCAAGGGIEWDFTSMSERSFTNSNTGTGGNVNEISSTTGTGTLYYYAGNSCAITEKSSTMCLALGGGSSSGTVNDITTYQNRCFYIDIASNGTLLIRHNSSANNAPSYQITSATRPGTSGYTSQSAVGTGDDAYNYQISVSTYNASTACRIWVIYPNKSYIEKITWTPAGASGTCYHVTYDGNGATSGFVNDTTAYKSGDEVTVLDNDGRYPYVKGLYEIKGWADTKVKADARTVDYAPGATFTITADKTLYAVWSDEYAITYNLNGASWAGGYTAPAQYTYGTGATLPVAGNMTNVGYTFNGWYANSDLSTGGVIAAIGTSESGAKEFWAKWTENTYTVTYNANEGSGDAMENTVGHYVRLSTNTYTAPSGKIFVEWNTKSDGTGDSYRGGEDIELEADMTLYAIWADDYTISWGIVQLAGAGAEVTPNLGGGNYTITASVSAWTGTLTAGMISTLTDGVTITNVAVDNIASPKTATVTFSVGANVAGESITLEIDVPADGSYSAQSSPKEITIDRCTGSSVGGDGVLFSAEFKDSGLGTSNICDAANDSYTFTTAELKSAPTGGSIEAYTTGELSHLKYVDNGVYLKGADGVIKITLDAAISTNDLFEYVNVHSSCPNAYLRHTSPTTTSDQIVLTGYSSRNVKVMLPAAFNGKTELYIVKNSTDFKLHKAAIVRPAFLMLVDDEASTGNLEGTNVELTTSTYLSVMKGGHVYYTSPTSGDVKITQSSSKNYITLAKTAGYLKVVLNDALQEGDIIGFDTSNGSSEICFATTTTRSTDEHTSSQLYTVGSSSPLKEQKTFYIWYYSSSTTIRGLQIARSGIAGGGGGTDKITPTLSWETDLTGGESKRTSDGGFVHTASQNKNSLGAITYSSNNTAVATVNATTGEVHLEGTAGDATITATIAASGCYNTASVSYTVTVVDDCDDVAGTITTEELGCSSIRMTITGHTTTASTSYQWYKDGVSLGSADGAQTATYTTSVVGSYYVIVTNTGDRHCAKRSRNTVEVEAQAAPTATKIVNSWYVKNGRRTPDVELVQTTNANGFIVKIGDTKIWDEENSITTGFGGCGFHLGNNGIIYLNGTTAEDGSGDAPSGLTGDGGTEVLKITAKGCGGDADELSITIHKQVPAEGARPSIAFVVDGKEKKGFDQASADHSTNSALFKFLDYGDDSSGAFDLTAQNIYSTTDEQAIREHYSQFDAIIITDDPNTKKNPANKDGDYYKNHSYVNAFGTMIDVRPMLSMEAFVSRLANWSAKGVAGDPSSPNPRPYEMRLQCKDHEIYTGLPSPAPGTHVWIETIDDEEYRHVVMVDKTKSPYTGLADNEKTSGDGEVPALQGFAASAMGDLLGLGVISEGALQAAIERQEEPAARMMLLGVNAKALPNALTEEGKKVIENALKYLLKTNMEEVDDCSNFFKGGASGDERNWNNTDNWAKSTLPNYETKVRILAPCEVSGIHVRVAQIDIATSGTSSKIPSGTCSGSLTIKEDGALIVGGKVRTAEAPHFAANDLKPTTPEDLIILSNESGTGALIFDNSDGKAQATVQMYSVSHWKTEAGKKKKYWSYVGVPIADVEIPDYFYLGFTYLYDETSESVWVKKWDGSVLQPFEGIGLSMQAGHRETFRGTLASTKTKEITLTKTAEGGDGQNLIGNSWTAPIQIANFETADFGGATATVYIYNTGRDEQASGSTGTDSYGADGADSSTPGQWVSVPVNVAKEGGYTGLKVIPAMNAFQVNTTSEATLTLDYDKLVRKNAASNAQINNPLRAPRRDAPKEVEALMRVRVSGEKTHTDVWLLQDERFSDGFDNGWEATYAECDNRSAQLYAVSELGQMAFIAKPYLEGTPIGFAPSRDGNVYTFSFQYTGDDTYYLNDLKEEKSTLIEAENTYLFTYEEGEMSPRFLISTTPFESPSITTGVGNVGHSEKAQKIIYNDHVYIIRGGKIYDVMGKMMK